MKNYAELRLFIIFSGAPRGSIEIVSRLNQISDELHIIYEDQYKITENNIVCYGLRDDNTDLQVSRVWICITNHDFHHAWKLGKLANALEWKITFRWGLHNATGDLPPDLVDLFAKTNKYRIKRIQKRFYTILATGMILSFPIIAVALFNSNTALGILYSISIIMISLIIFAKERKPRTSFEEAESILALARCCCVG